MRFIRFFQLMCVAAVFTLPLNTLAVNSVQAIALFENRAMLSIDGKKAKVIKAGSTYFGVTLISSTTSEAVIEIDGRRETLTLSGGVILSRSLAAKAPQSYRSSVELYENESGFFEVSGEIDGRGIKFLVDTGASLVVLSSRDAKRIGLEYRDGQRGFASTASGTAPMFNISLDKISIGGIELRNVHAGVIEGNFPEHPLLGMTFLSRLDMNRSGNVMTLTKR